MKEPFSHIGSIRWVDIVYKSGSTPVLDYKNWDSLMEYISHKRGPRPQCYRLYTEKGIYSFTITP